MNEFTLHTIETAPEKSKPMLEKSQKAYAMVPNLHAVLATSPSTFAAYQALHEFFISTSFDAEELTVVWQTINVEHGCTYCVPAHTVIAHSMKVSPALIEALRNNEAMPTEKLQALKDFTLSIVRNRGNVTKDELSAFFAVGYGQQQVLEVILGLSQKVISNYINHVAETPVDEAFKQFAWKK